MVAPLLIRAPPSKMVAWVSWLVSKLEGKLEGEIGPERRAAWMAYGAAVMAWRGSKVVREPRLPFGRAAISSQRLSPANGDAPKSIMTVNRPLLTGTEGVITGPATIPPLKGES